MPSRVMSSAKPSSVLNTFVGTLKDTAVSTFKEIAPVWTEQLIRRRNDDGRIVQPTFQETTGQPLNKDTRLTTNVDEADLSKPKFSFNQSSIVIAGLAGLALVLLMRRS